MATNVIAIGRRMFVWIVVIAAGIESVANAIVAAFHQDGAAVAVWTLAGLALMTLGAAAESVKAFLEA